MSCRTKVVAWAYWHYSGKLLVRAVIDVCKSWRHCGDSSGTNGGIKQTKIRTVINTKAKLQEQYETPNVKENDSIEYKAKEQRKAASRKCERETDRQKRKQSEKRKEPAR
jgi:hypothetical protein